MKKSLSFLLCVCMLFATFNITVFAAEEISSFGITMSGFKGGAKESDVTFTLSDDRLSVKNVSLSGSLGEGDTFIENKQYTFRIMVEIKDGVNANFPEKILKEDIQFSGDSATVSSAQKVMKNLSLITITINGNKREELLQKAAGTLQKEEPLQKEAEEEKAPMHNHCYCGGYIENIGDHTSHQTVEYKAWPGEKAIKYANSVAHIYLEEDVLLDNTLNIGGGRTLYLCLNGHALAMKYRGQRIINVSVGGKLYLCNCTRSEGGKITSGEAEYGAGIHNNGTVRMYGGIITKNNGGYGGGVYNNANFYLYGGDIYDNKALHGGGVCNDNDGEYKFIMYEGMIHLNVSSTGGGIYNNDHANLLLKGGTITLNASKNGGGVWNNGGNVTLDGCMILENTAAFGGGIWNNGGGLLEIKSGNISKNMATSDPFNINGYGGGVWNNDKGIINMTGGEITFNKAAFGGGVWSNPDSEFMMSDGVIAENEAEYGGGIYVSAKGSQVATYLTPPPPARFRITNKAGVVLNTATVQGGGAYVEGTLEFEGEGEVTGNIAGTPDNIDVFAAEGAKINRNSSMTTQFVDVASDAYYIEPVKWAVEKNITTGTRDVTFSPDNTCNTAQILTFLWRAAGSPTVTNPFPYADVYKSDYFYMAAQWARKKGMIEHYALYPNFDCNRQGAVYYIWCAAGKPACKTPLKFTDTQDPAYEKYYEAIAWAVEQGITNGTSDTTFSPGKTCTRAQIVTFLWRAAQKGLI